MTSPVTTTPTTPTTPAVQLRPELAEQVHALHHTARLLLAAGLAGLSLTFNDDRITIQIGAELGDAHDRAAMVAHLAAIVGTRSRRWGGTGPTADWIRADGHLAGHLVHIFTAIKDTTS